MKRWAVLVGLILCLSSLGFSQEGGRFYGFFAAGQVRAVDYSESYLNFGAGGMYLGSKGYGGGAEMAAVGQRTHDFNQVNFN
jgi:hypothetical protein